MQIDESRRLLFSDTLVPDIFITEYLPALDGLAVKLYVYALFAARARRTFTEAELARRLGADPDAVRAATAQLAAAGLVQMKERGFEIVDVKAVEVGKVYRPRTSSEPETAGAEPGAERTRTPAEARRAARDKLLADIAKTFFQGLMAPAWYYEVDSWFDRYRFEPEVIYALFRYCADRGKLDGKGYIAAVAQSWSTNGIVTFQDLSAYFAEREKLADLSRKVGRRLRKAMTQYDEELVANWANGLGYGFDVVDLALRRTVKLRNPNLAFVDGILKEWSRNGVKTPEDVERYEGERMRRIAAERRAEQAAGTTSAPGPDGGRGRARNAGNFVQREYSDEYLGSLYEEVSPPDPDDPDAATPPPPEAPPAARGSVPPAVLPGQLDLFRLEAPKE